MEITLFVKIIDQVGGTEIGTMRLARALKERDVRVTLLSTQALSQWRKHPYIFDYANEFRIIRLPVWQRSPIIFAYLLRLHTHWIFPILLRRTHLMHLRGLSSETLQIAHIAQRYHIKTLCVPAASGILGDTARLPSSSAHQIDSFDWISTLTPSMQMEIRQLGFAGKRMSVIPNGVDARYFSPPTERPPIPHVIFIGQFRPEKQIDILLQAWQRVQNHCLDGNLTLVGGGLNVAPYRTLANAFDIAPVFVPVVAQPAVRDYLRQHSVFVMPGNSEGMSNALLEAMAVGLVPVVSDTPANCAVIEDGVNGLTYRSTSPDDLSVKLIRLLKDASLRERLGNAARATILQRYTLDHVADAYINLYKRILGTAA